MPAAPGGQYLDGAWHRLHPATPLLRGGIGLLAVLLWLGANLRERLVALVFGLPDSGGDPLDALSRHHLLGIGALIVAGVLVVGIVLFWFAWRASTFRIDGEAVTVRHGILLRTTRTAKLDRIQGVTISRPLFARLVGAARVELDVAGHDANVRLEYLSSGAAEELRRDVLRLASGQRQAVAEQPAAEAGVPILAIGPGRALGSVLLSEPTLIVVLVTAIGIPVLTAVGAAPAAGISLGPLLIAAVTVAARRTARNLRYSVTATPDGVRIGAGILSTSNEAVPPGRIHAVRIEQPLLWRPAGWWRVSVNRAGRIGGRRNAELERSIAPVASREEVLALVPHLVPGLAAAGAVLAAGLTGRGHDEDFVPAPRRARWLRPLAWRRTGFLVTDGAVLLRGGFLRRHLTIVPEARIQSVALHQGPAERLLGVATIEPHVVHGPVRTRLGLIDEPRAVALFVQLDVEGQQARSADTSHRWAASVEEAPA
ncbi:PH domain-containing protein [Amnibacterium sp. CER49]|uniref:PH domain-containing protein n=1 Tax=Amnibacterium sp. CER49 TaxID=3039161 RepID=UPI00244ADB94|nr:PH domain-containing protein [Amnibacterium sp. CER49]MDH2443786.1 PH domain-containing protein [Amnibacterium sp. CER49]